MPLCHKRKPVLSAIGFPSEDNFSRQLPVRTFLLLSSIWIPHAVFQGIKHQLSSRLFSYFTIIAIIMKFQSIQRVIIPAGIIFFPIQIISNWYAHFQKPLRLHQLEKNPIKPHSVTFATDFALSRTPKLNVNFELYSAKLFKTYFDFHYHIRFIVFCSGF